MELGDALAISALGMGVVFGGLTLTALLIVAVGRLPVLLARLADRRRRPAPGAAAAELSAPDPTIVAVIAAALEVERRLHRAEQGRRLTIERDPSTPRDQA